MSASISLFATFGPHSKIAERLLEASFTQVSSVRQKPLSSTTGGAASLSIPGGVHDVLDALSRREYRNMFHLSLQGHKPTTAAISLTGIVDDDQESTVHPSTT